MDLFAGNPVRMHVDESVAMYGFVGDRFAQGLRRESLDVLSPPSSAAGRIVQSRKFELLLICSQAHLTSLSRPSSDRSPAFRSGCRYFTSEL